MKYKILVLLTAILITSCAPALEPSTGTGTLPPDTAVISPSQDDLTTEEPMQNPFSPQPDDSKFTRGNIFIEESGLLIRESYPPQIVLGISGNLPTPCHQLRAEISDPDADNKIHVEIYTVVDPAVMCTQVLQPFQENIELGTFPSGHYSVWVNGELVGEFDS